MEPAKPKIPFDVEANLAARRRRYNNLVIVFKLFFISLTLIIAALITYLVRTEFSEQTINQNPPPQFSDPNTTTQSQLFICSLRRAAQELQKATSLILSDHPHNTTHETAFTRCRNGLQTGSRKIREVIWGCLFHRRPSDEHRAEMAKRVAAVEDYIESCLEDLASTEESSAAANEVRERVCAAELYLRGRGDFLVTPPELGETVWVVILQNLFFVFMFGVQMMFIFFLFRTIFKSLSPAV